MFAGCLLCETTNKDSIHNCPINFVDLKAEVFEIDRYSWSAYDVIKILSMQIVVNLLQMLIWPIRPYDMSLYQIWSYLDLWKQSYGQKKSDIFSVMLYGKIGW